MNGFEKLPQPVERKDADRIMRAVSTAVASLDVFTELGVVDPRALRFTINAATRHRFATGEEFLNACTALDVKNEPVARLVIGRAYYALYHCARAFLFYKLRKDVDEHRDVIKQLKAEDGTLGALMEMLRGWRDTCDYDVQPQIGPAAGLRVTLTGYARIAAIVATRVIEELRKKLRDRGLETP